MLKIGYYQFRPRFGRVSANLKKVVAALRHAEADLLVLPELPFTGYFHRDREEALTLAEDPKTSATVAALIDLCRERNFYLVTGFSERQRDKVFNSALLLGPEGHLHTYRKLHLFNQEKNWFDPGDMPLSVQEIRGAKIGMMICFDWVFPEVMRTLAVLGAHVICHPSNLVLNYCQQTMLSRCLENSVFAVTANRFGADQRPHGDVRFTGKSQIVAPKGGLLLRAYSQREQLDIMEIEPQLSDDKHITPLNDMFADRRPEFYTPLCSSKRS